MAYLLRNISNLVTCSDKTGKPKSGKTQSDIGLVKKGSLLFGNKILYAGKETGLKKFLGNNKIKITCEIDCTGKTVMPGFVDSHTHLVFAGSRSNEYEMRIQGKSYEEIANAGGGIKSTVKNVRNTGKNELFRISEKRLANFLKYGTTTLEAKSGYGLDTANEIKMLEVIKMLDEKNKFGVDILPTFLGAHAVPSGMNKKDYIDLICYEMIPLIAKRKLAVFIDVFCEKGYFDAAETERILTTGAKFGLIPKIHSEQFNSIGGVKTAVNVKAISIDHLEVLDGRGIGQLKNTGIIAALLPGASYFLDISYPPAREIIRNGIPAALATDFNPGSCMTENMQMIMSLASVKMKMTAEEIINAVTINGAYAIFVQKLVGSLEAGKQSDILVFDFESYKDLVYHFGVNQIVKVFKKGLLVKGLSDV
ncbi:MAG: imidazolonepropionase [Ignavibacteria bacterium]|jgi:imidazolonepropionase|nr:imidazolonepropionase [Ignavibacteria bacterium]